MCAARNRLRFRMRNFLWADGSPMPRMFDQAMMTLCPSTSSDQELLRNRKGGLNALWKGHDLGGRPCMSIANPNMVPESLQFRVKTLLDKRRKQAANVVPLVALRDQEGEIVRNPDGTPQKVEPTRLADAIQLKLPTADGATISLMPPPPPMRALRLGVRNYDKEGCTGLHMKPVAPKTLAHMVDLRVKIRTVVLGMNATSDDGAPPPTNPIGYSELYNGIRFQKCGEVGTVLQEAWGYAVSERLFNIWKTLQLSKDGVPYKFPSSASMQRTGIEACADIPHLARSGLPGLWCPPKPRSAHRNPSRPMLRAFLGLLLEQKRIHCDEIVKGYQYWAELAGMAERPDMAMLPPMDEADPPLIKLHALLCLKNLKYNKRANARWETLIKYQLAPEDQAPCEPQAVAAELRKAEGKIKGLEELLIQGLAEFSDARGALRMHMFDADADIPLRQQLANRLAGVMFGELLQQRFEHLDIPEHAPRQLGVAEKFGDDAGPVRPEVPFLMPAPKPPPELSVDNVLLGIWIGIVPAMVRNAFGGTGGAPPVGDPAAFDALLSRKLMDLQTTTSMQRRLTFAAIARFAWGAYRKPSDSVGAKPEPNIVAPPGSLDSPSLSSFLLDGASASPITDKQKAQVLKFLMPMIKRIRGAIPKGAVPDDPIAQSALKEEINALDKDATEHGDPTEDDLEIMRQCLAGLLDLVQACCRVMRHKGHAELPAPDGPDEQAAAREAEAAAKANVAGRMKVIRASVNDALQMSYDMFQASKLDADSVLACAGEAVADVGVEQSDLIQAIFKLLYRSTFMSVITAPKIPIAASRRFLATLVKRKPCIHAPDEATVREWALREDKGGDIVGEYAAAKKWAKDVANALEASRDGQRSLLQWITFLTLNELRQVQGALSQGTPKILLADLVAGGVGGVAKNVLLAKLDKAMVPDTNAPLKLAAAYRLLPGRDAPAPPAGAPKKNAYTLPVAFAEDEEEVRGAADVPLGPGELDFGKRLLDIGQLLAPDGSQFNIIRLHRTWMMQHAAADRVALLTIERMMDEFVTLDIKAAFFPLDGEAPSDQLIRGRPDVMKYLIAEGFTQTKVGGFDGKQKGSGMQYAQPVILTNDGQTRVVFGSGKRDTCGALADRFRMGEQIKWTPWGQIAQIVRVEKPLASHFEWVSFFQMANFAGVKKYLDKEADYYVITHTLFPESPAAPCFNAMKFSGQEDVFKRLDNEMSRQGGNISCISPTFTGDKLKDLRMRRAVAIDADASQVAFGEKNHASADIQAKVAIAKEAYNLCLTYGGPGEGPKRSVLHFCGRWLPLGEGSNRKGQLVCLVRETIGWKYDTKPPPPGKEEKPSAARGVGLLVREFFIGKRGTWPEPEPRAPGFRGCWEMHKKRNGM